MTVGDWYSREGWSLESGGILLLWYPPLLSPTIKTFIMGPSSPPALHHTTWQVMIPAQLPAHYPHWLSSSWSQLSLSFLPQHLSFVKSGIPQEFHKVKLYDDNACQRVRSVYCNLIPNKVFSYLGYLESISWNTIIFAVSCVCIFLEIGSITPPSPRPPLTPIVMTEKSADMREIFSSVWQ